MKSMSYLSQCYWLLLLLLRRTLSNISNKDKQFSNIIWKFVSRPRELAALVCLKTVLWFTSCESQQKHTQRVSLFVDGRQRLKLRAKTQEASKGSNIVKNAEHVKRNHTNFMRHDCI